MTPVRIRTQTEVSAGGLVISADDPSLVALISHRNRGGGADWVIPKGHQEKGEELQETALREVKEETGIEAEIIKKIGEITYSFRLGPVRIKKTVHHFLMRQVGGDLTHEDDPEGEVLKVAWFPISKLEEVLAHDNERKVAMRAVDLMP
jgi:8-oxo-dGTP pyrophosphatase MutT (NUDIX family)